MPASIISGFAPNRLTATNSDDTTDPILIGMSGTGYASLTACLAAGDRPFPFGNAAHPGLDTGMFTQYLTVENVTQAKAFSVAWNIADPPTVDSATLLPDGIPFFEYKGPVNFVWLIKSVGTDDFVFTIGY